MPRILPKISNVVSALAVGFALLSGPALATDPFPLALGGPYKLVDQNGSPRTQADPDGRAQLVFFGYINCPDICTAAMPMMAELTDMLADEGIKVTPVMITIAPDQDTSETMKQPLADLHPRYVGLTGDKESLEAAYAAYSVEIKPLFQDPEHGWIYAHGSFIHLLDGNGDILTLIPPSFVAEQAIEIVRPYLTLAN